MAAQARSPTLTAGAGAVDDPDATGVIDSAKDTAEEVDNQFSLAFQVGADSAEELARDAGLSNARIMDVVRVIGGAMIGLAVLVVVLNSVFTLDTIQSGSGPFQSVIDSLETTGGAALGLLVIGLLVVAANRIMGFFGRGGF
jgi:aspartate oxidase